MLFLLPSFCLLTDPMLRAFCTTVVWPMMMEVFDVMFSGKSVYVSWRLMAIEPMTALNLLLVCAIQLPNIFFMNLLQQLTK